MMELNAITQQTLFLGLNFPQHYFSHFEAATLKPSSTTTWTDTRYQHPGFKSKRVIPTGSTEASQLCLSAMCQPEQRSEMVA